MYKSHTLIQYAAFLRIGTGIILLAQFDIKICLEKVQLHEKIH